jgi:hypothetical protein
MIADLNPLPEDPLGHRLDLAEALTDPDLAGGGSAASQAAAWVLIALGRCRIFGVPLPPEVVDRAATVCPAAVLDLRRRLADWTESARTLGTRWDAAADPWEADELCAALIELRTDAWAAETALAEFKALAPEVKALIGAFDAALNEQISVLSTISGTNWFENYRAGLAAGITPPWWLGSELEAAARLADDIAAHSLPPADFWAVVRTASRWKIVFPSRVEVRPLAAEPKIEQPPPAFLPVRWMSPDGRYLAELLLPEQSSEGLDRERRPLLVWRLSDSELATELIGRPIRLGAFADQVEAPGQVWLTLEMLRDNCDGRLFVGDPAEEWPLKRDPEP